MRAISGAFVLLILIASSEVFADKSDNKTSDYTGNDVGARSFDQQTVGGNERDPVGVYSNILNYDEQTGSYDSVLFDYLGDVKDRLLKK